jgi:Tol biopolymer transport system component
MNADGSDRVRLTAGPNDFAPTWSPDGARIAFVRTSASSQRQEIVVMNADGTDQRSLTPAGESDSCPAWSPDGGQIALVRNILEDGSRHGQILVTNTDGSNQKRLTRSTEFDGSPL